ncbi:MAG: YCF48-related protein [Ignavibacterium sp.]|jgi:photosystem II stability/assembly factor-like uncharacterized protein|nr:YCF48-related protein [Ignavibacterium sp.]
MSKIKSYILLIVFINLVDCYPQSSWEKIKTPTDFNLLKVFFLDSLHCWVAGDSGVILFSDDSGDSWRLQNSGVNNFISDIYFLNKNLGWAVSYDFEGINIRSKILKTTNGGLNWQNENYRQLNVILTTIFFYDSLNGWIGGEPFALSYTTNGGIDWLEAAIDSGTLSYFPVSQIRFDSPNYGFACGGANDIASVIWRSTNGGKNWVSYGIQADPFVDFQFLDSYNIISLAGDRERLYPVGKLNTYENGTFWNYDTIPFYGVISGMKFRTDNEVWATMPAENYFIVSQDTGNTWDDFRLKDSIRLLDIDFADSLHGIAVGRGGYILKYIPDKPVHIENTYSMVPVEFILDQNFPNPFNPRTKIRWQSPFSGHNTLKVYDVLGTEIATLVDEYKSAGVYEVDFTVGQSASGEFSPDIGSGIYFYQLIVGNYIETKKMVLLR